MSCLYVMSLCPSRALSICFRLRLRRLVLGLLLLVPNAIGFQVRLAVVEGRLHGAAPEETAVHDLKLFTSLLFHKTLTYDICSYSKYVYSNTYIYMLGELLVNICLPHFPYWFPSPQTLLHASSSSLLRFFSAHLLLRLRHLLQIAGLILSLKHVKTSMSVTFPTSFSVNNPSQMRKIFIVRFLLMLLNCKCLSQLYLLTLLAPQTSHAIMSVLIW